MSMLFKRAGVVVGLLFLVSILDGLVSGCFEPKGVSRVFPGRWEWISGTAPAKIPSRSSLAFASRSPHVTMEFAEPEGNVWRGKVRVAEGTEAGDYPYQVYIKEQPTDASIPENRVLVFHSEAAYRDSFHSVLRKYLGISPWRVTALSLPLLALCFAVSFRAAAREEAALNGVGLATVFKVTRKNEARQISFGLGGEEGLDVGDSVLIFDRESRRIGEGRVISTGHGYATASVDPGLEVQPSFLVDMRSGKRRCAVPADRISN